ncbi:MAG: DUF4258 domain-containing protein [Candidatus Lambdaproteobacteria bacterium]|nr:DUF4258 domain-containing protein [Candidatus Lambdaproteobacteria bacterium]
MRFRLSKHVEEELRRRRIPREALELVLEVPQQIIEERIGRKAYQSQVEFEGGKLYLLRAIVFDGVDPALVVTAYRTSRIRKYWREP